MNVETVWFVAAQMSNNPKNLTAAILAAAAMAAGFEGIRQNAYYDPRPDDAILTVCYGHTGDDIEKGRKYSMDECRALLAEDMQSAVAAVDKCHPNLPFNVLVAFSDAAYNIGPKIACNSTASKYLSQGNYEAACKELPKWNKANGQVLPGLTRRRNKEMEICLDSTNSQSK